MANTTDLKKMFEKGKRRVRRVPQKANSWGANMLKSLGHSALEVFEEITPNMANIASSSVEAASDLKETLTKNKGSGNSLKASLDQNVYVGIGKDWFQNALADLKSGKLYNQDRYAETVEAAMNDMDLGFGDDDFNFEFDDDFGGDEDFESSFDDTIVSDDGGATASFSTKSKNGNTVTQVVMSNNIGPDSPIVAATENQTEILIQSSEIATKTSIAGTQAMLQMTSKFGNDITSLLSTINESVADFSSNSTKILSEHSTSAIQFYSDSMEVQKGILEELKGLRESMTTQIAATSTLRPQKEANDLLNMFSSGTVDLSEYIKFVKKNVTSTLQSNLFTSNIMSMTSDTDTLKALAANPLSFVPKAIISKLIPSITKAAIGQLDKTIGEFAIGALTKLGSKRDSHDDPIGSFFGKLFGIQNDMRTTVDRGNYEKGPVPWDGIARRTLVDVIPSYLSQIAAAVTGTEQMVFDYDRGVYKTLRSIKKERSDMITSTMTSPFFDDIMQFNEMVNQKYTGRSQDEINDIKDLFRKLIVANVNHGGGINYRIRNGKDELSELLGLYTGSPELELIRSFFEGRHLAGNNEANIRFFGRAAQEARINVSRTTEQIEKDPIYSNMQYLNNGLDDVDNSHMQTFKNGSIALKGTGGPNADKYGKRPAEYLRDILIRLNNGILVEVTNQIADNPRGRRRKRNGPPPNPPSNNESTIAASSRKTIEKLKREDDDLFNKRQAKNGLIARTNDYYDDDIAKGKVDIIDAESISTTVAQEYHQQRLDSADKEQYGVGKKTLLSRFIDTLPPGMRKVAMLVDEQISKAGTTVAKGIGKVNDYLYSMLFGKDDNTSVMNDILNRIKGLFGGVKTFLSEKILNPLDKALFGEDGFFTRIKESELMKDAKDAFGRAKESIFGVKTTDADGKVTYEGGLLSDTMTELRSMGTSVKTAIFGDKKTPTDKDTSILGSIKRMGKQVGESISAAVGLKSDDPKEPLSSRLAGKLDDVWLGVKDRFSEWSDLILGPKIDDKGKQNFVRQGLSSFMDDMKDQRGAIGAGAVVGGVGIGLLGSQVGFLSSIFLPGGPIGGALLGAGIAIVNKSETLKTMLFGPEENGERTGGLITKEIVDFVSDNKKGLIAGGFLGLAGSMGIIPSMFVPGGPIGGAIIGGALSMATKTEAFQEFLYGEGGTKDDPTGGLMKKFKDIFGKDKDCKGLALNAGIGAGVGLIGSFFLPGGPILGALIGSAASVAMNTEKFKNFMFGEEEFDEDGESLGRKGGVFGKVTDFINAQIFKPLANTAKTAQIKMIGFVEREMIAPLLSALSPITNKLEEVGLNIKDGFSGFFKSIGDKFNDAVTKPIGDALEPYIEKMKSVLNKIFGGIFKAIGAVISSPFKLIGAVGRGIFESDKRRGANAATNEVLDGILDFKGRRERGERMGLFGTTVAEVDENGVATGKRKKVGRGFFGNLVHAYSKEVREAGAYSDKGAGKYATSEKNPYTIERDYIAKSKAKEAERLAKLNNSGKSSMAQFRDWLNSKSPKTTTVNVGSVDPKLIKDAYDSFVAAGIPNPEEMALQQFGIESDDPVGAIKRLIRGRGLKGSKKSSKSTGKKGKAVSNVDVSVSDGDKIATVDSTTKIADAVTTQTDISTEQHKESIGIVESIRDRLDTLLERFDIERPKVDKKDKSPNIDYDVNVESKTVPVDTNGKRLDDVGSGGHLSKIAIEVDKISDSVYGQLNGVGSNINKIYRLLLKLSGHSDDDIKGDNNKEYVGFFGKLRTMLNNPVKAVMNIIMTPARLIGKGLTTIKNIFVEGAKSIWEGTKAFVGGIAQAGLSLLQLPVQAMKMLGTVLKNTLPVLKETLVGGIKSVTAVVTEAIHVGGAALVEGVHVIGSMLQGAAEGFGALVGGALSGLGSLLDGLGLLGKGVLKGIVTAGKGLFKFGGKMIGGALSLGSTLIGNALGGIFGKNGDGLFKRRMDVYVVGGTLDEVVLVTENDPSFHKEFMKTLGIYVAGIRDDIDRLRTGGPTSPKDADGEPPLIPIENAVNTIATNMGMPGFSSSLGFSAYPGARMYAGNGTAPAWFKKATAKFSKKNADDTDQESKPKQGTTEAYRAAASVADEKAEELDRHEGMMGVLGNILSVNKEQHTSWLSVFGLKKGLISIGLIAAIPLLIRAIPLVMKAWPAIKEFGKKIASGVATIGEWLGNFFGSIPGAFKDSGGVKGVLNNASELYDNFGQLVDGKKTQTVINDDGTVDVVTDAEGNVIDVAKETIGVGLLDRFKNFVMPERAKIDTETGEAYRERSLSGVSLAFIKRKFMKSKLMKPIKRALGNKLLQGEIAAGKAIGKGVSKVMQTEAVQGLINTGKTLVKGTASKLASAGKEFAGGAMAKIAEKLSINPDKAIETVTKVTDSGGLIKNFINMAKDAIVKLADDVVGFLASKGIVGDAAIKVASSIKGNIGKITEKVCKPFVDKIKSLFGKAATSAASGFLAELGFGAIGAIVANPAQVFGVNKGDVNITMQIIARFMKGLLSTSMGSWFDLINQIVYYTFGFDFVGEVCVLIYNALAGDAGREELKKAREAFNDDYAEFSRKEYEAYARKAQESGKPVMSQEEFQASDLATSRSQYNEQKNPDLIQRAINGASNGIGWVKRKIFGGKGGDDQLGGFGEGDEGDTNTKPAPNQMNGIPYFSQNDPNYKDVPYNLSNGSEDTMSSRGCGPTAMAMIGKAYGVNTDPKKMADMATRGGYSTEVGTVPKFFNDASSHMGIKSEQLPADQVNVSTALAGGSPILLQGQDEDPTSPFTSKGHYVVGTRLASGTGIAINDPRGPEYSGVYPMSTVLKGAKNMWVFGNGQSVPSMEETGGFGIGDSPMTSKKTVLSEQIRGVTAEKVIKVAANEVGYIEKASNSQLEDKTANPGSANYTKYNQCVGSNPQYWCAAFVCWCFEQAAGGDKEKVRQLLCGSKSAACNTLMSQFKSAGRFDNTPKLGDCVFFSGSRHGGANHIAIVVGVDSSKVYTIEGNTSGNAGVVDNGGEVAFKQYVIGADRILGYGHPVFDAETNFAGIVGEGQLAASASSSGSSTVYTDASGSSSNSSSGTGFIGMLSNLATGIGNIYMKAFGFNVDDGTSGSAASIASSGASNLLATATGSAPLTGNSVEEQVWNYFTSHGFTKEATAGIMGNIWQESKFKPDAIQHGSGHAAGLFQWESYKNKAARWANLNKLAQSVGKDWTDLGTQLDFGHSEMQNEKWMWKTTDKGASTNINSFDQFKALNNVEDATHEFEVHFERANPEKANMAGRKQMARTYYETYKNMVPGAQNGTTNNAASNAGINVATARAEGGTSSSSKPVTSSSLLAGLANKNIALQGMGGFGGDDETKMLGEKLGVSRQADRMMYAAPMRRHDAYGGFGSATGDDNGKVVELLGTIATETGGINSGVRTLNDKEIPAGGNVQNVYHVEGGKTNVTNNNVSTPPSKSAPFTDDYDALGSDYSVAKRIAKSMIGS